jgi:hypothetical protein
MDTVGYLPPIQEGTATSLAESVTKDVGGTVGAAGTPNASKDTPSMMANTVPLAAEPREVQTTTFIFRAQLTWGLDPGSRVHLPTLFREWFVNSSKHIPGFALLPFEDDKGQEILTSDQVPDDNPTFYSDYYYNHRVLRHGNMTGMVHFRCMVSWNKVKRMKDPYFQWLSKAKVYINLAKFKSATLVVCGFFVGAHPGHLR